MFCLLLLSQTKVKLKSDNITITSLHWFNKHVITLRHISLLKLVGDIPTSPEGKKN